MRDKKHRINSTIVLLVSLLLSMYMFFMLSNKTSMELSAVISFAFGVILVVLFQIYGINSIKHDKTKLNAITQVWFGIIIIIASVFVVLLNTIFGVEFTTAVLCMVGLVFVLMFLTIKKFDEYLETKHKLA